MLAGAVQASDEKITLTIHANLSSETAVPRRIKLFKKLATGSYLDLLSEAEVVTAGHAWISVKDSNQCKTYGLFGEGVTVDAEKKYDPGILRSTTINREQYKALMEAIESRNDYNWMGYYNCASYASELWEAATGEFINPIPRKLFYSSEVGGVYSSKQNTKLNPLPPSPLGIIQDIIKKRGGSAFVSDDQTVCP
ncbi:hypothetical protein OL309_004745 [Vibrio parahaemolyticus]|nr:hypothetical protein [Vibrio parahaemolyticus]HCE4715413.1 hypothetical protein [Vibrio parahaemolyticus]HCG9795759.1 hypothetical protein [Vibrio parahaemolyticus]HCH4925175.1 hypothetical protein [Vibrio parahaemolyticus]